MKTKLKAGPAKFNYKYDMEKDGITTSFAKKWRSDRESARLGYVEGWRGLTPSFPLVYGSAAHWCLHKMYNKGIASFGNKECLKLIQDYDAVYKKDRGQAPWTTLELEYHEKTLGFLEAVLPEYVKRVTRKDGLYNDAAREWFSLEETFTFNMPVAVLCPLHQDKNGPIRSNLYGPKVVSIPIRGRIDGVFRWKGKLWVLETKNLSVIDEDGIMEKLPRDLQANIYAVAVTTKYPDEPFGGVLYNILRRPGLRLGKTESMQEFMGRVKIHVKEDWDHYFLRFECNMTARDVETFTKKRLTPLVSSMYEWWRDLEETGGQRLHYDNDEELLTKYGRNTFFHAICNGDFSGLRKRKVVFTELED